ncbi:peroxisomal leader peptide-processing protease [Callorhinchus milii]|uniref:Peroxisomal leader peptide-processing protease n=1 Tax=Callorhinchus milii TaxID=7868 RepID=A0A4W3GPI9_CALMI|nr:peroxisomal leader peptide-processing protease [Callorhinchus milii]|eukprot:gi/632936734/ref/XP_007895918.1/ PREDICTED: peroxisomal leader peptide-processing protease [Callorhinchus milii]
MIAPEDWSCIVSASVQRGGAGGIAPDPTGPERPVSCPGQDRSCRGSDRDGAWSCSGVILDRRRGVVLCHGLIFLPFLQQPDRDLTRGTFLLPGAFHKDLRVQVQFSRNDCKPKQVLPVRENDATGQDFDDPASGFKPSLSWTAGRLTDAQLPHSQAEMLMLCSCPEFRQIFRTLFSKLDKWHFYSEEEKSECGKLQNDSLGLVWFGVLQCPGWQDCPGGDHPQYISSTSLQKGEPLFTCASPFASFSSHIFMNTFSKGIVSNLAGEDNAMILTDARCLPGTEGGGVYIKSKDLYYLAGLIVAPLCWKANEWIGLTLVCSVGSIIKNIGRFLKVFDYSGKRMLPFWTVPDYLTIPGRHRLTQLLSTVALLESGRVWGSGVIISPKLILTCRHVLNGESTVKVKIHPDSNRCLVLKGRVLFATKDNSAYDVAVVELEEGLSAVETITAASEFNTGEDVYIVGYGVFGQRCSASVTSGVVSAVVTAASQPVMLQTTCAVHAGASGGPIFRKNSGELLGIVSSNARNNTVGASYPHLNFSIPITVLQPLLSVYTQSRDISVFETLNTANDRLHALWRLQGRLSSLQKSKL